MCAFPDLFDNPKKRCSIMWCPWKGKYSFGIKGYYECWFHYLRNEDSWYGVLWDTMTKPIKFLFNLIYYWIR